MVPYISFQMYLRFTEDLRLRARVYERLRVQVDSEASGNSRSDVVTVEKFVNIQQRWTYTTSRTRVWLWKLDSSLPGAVGQIGDWLYRAEEKVSEMAAQDHSTMVPSEAVHCLWQQLEDVKVLRYVAICRVFCCTSIVYCDVF